MAFALVAGMVVFHLAGGWYFSSVLETDGLEPRPPTRDLGVIATSVGDGVIALSGTDRYITHPGRFGLWWEGGYAQVDAILSASDDGTTYQAERVYTPIEGTPPTCPAPGAAGCVELDLEGVAYGDPTQAGVEVTDVTYESPLGAMDAWLIPDGQTTRWAILVHGWRTDRREALRALPTIAKHGLTALVVSYRNDPGAPPDPSGYYRFGRTEWGDVEGAVRYALDNGAEEVVLVGFSTGAAAILSMLERSAHRDAVAGLVFDSPNIDFGRAVKAEAAGRNLIGPVPLPSTLTATAMWLADLRFDIGWDAINYTSQRIGVPALVFQGSADQTVPPSVAADFAAANPEHVRLVETGADHVLSWNEDPERYERELGDFLASLPGS